MADNPSFLPDHEPSLVARLQGGDATAMTDFYHRYHKALRGVIARTIANQAEAEDVLQESLLKIWLKVPTYEPGKGRLFTWAARLCLNTAIDHLRASRHHAATAALEPDSHTHHLVAPVEFRPEHLDVRGYVQWLRPTYRVVLEKLYFEGLTQQQAAEALGIPLGTVKARALRGVADLGRALKQWEGG